MSDDNDSDSDYEPSDDESLDLSQYHESDSLLGREETVDDMSCPKEKLVEDIKSSTIREILPKAMISQDIDSMAISSSLLKPMTECFKATASFNYYCILDRTRAASSSRLSVAIKKNIHLSDDNKNLRRVSLAAFPNIELLTVFVGSYQLHLHMFWLNPPFMSKVPYFQNKYLLVITAALNMSKLMCASQTNFTDNQFNLVQDFFPSPISNKLKVFSEEMLDFSLSDQNRIPRGKRYSHDVSVIFLCLFQASLVQLGFGNTHDYKLEDLLPYDADHQEFSNAKNEVDDKMSFICELAKELCNSVTFTYSFSGYKHFMRATSMSRESANIPILDYDDWFNTYNKQAAKFLSKEFMNEIFNKKMFCHNIHIYYDIGLEIRHSDIKENVSYLPSLNGSSKLIREITKEHNEFPCNKISGKKALRIAYAMMYGVNNNSDSENLDLDIAMEEMETEMDILDYLSWGTNYQTNHYNVFFLTDFGNWHTGNSKTKRNMNSFNDDNNLGDTGYDAIYLTHLAKGGVCGAQMYCPQSRKVQLKQVRKATEYMDALASICCNILNNKKPTVSKEFSNVVNKIRTHMGELKTSATKLGNANTSIRIECLMKMDLFPADESNYIQFPQGFIEAEIGVCNTKELGLYYGMAVTEACDSLLSIFPSKVDNKLVYKTVDDFSPQAKTACIFQSEMLAMDFGTMNLKGSIMKVLQKMFKDQGSYTIPKNNKLRLKLATKDSDNSLLKYGLSPSLLAINTDINIRLQPGYIMNNPKMKLPLCMTASACKSVTNHVQVHVSYQQHRQYMLTILHTSLNTKNERE